MNAHMDTLAYVAPVFLVHDLDRALAYYQDRMGFALDFNYEGMYASVVRDGCRVHLKSAAPSGRDQQAFEDAEHIDACFAVSDASALASQFADAGATFAVRLRASPYGKEFYIKDPDGHILAFVQSGDAEAVS